MSKSKRKRHHVIPKFYLKGWKDLSESEDDLVWVLDKDTLRGKSRAPYNLFVKDYYFTEQELNGKRDDPVETHLGVNESNTAQLFRILDAGQPLAEIHIETLWRFVSSIFIRVTWWREYLANAVIHSALSQAPRRAADKVIKHLKKADSKELRRKAKSKAYCKQIYAKAESEAPYLLEQLATSLETKVHPSLVMASLTFEELRTYPFKIVRTNELSLLTSDTPCFVEEDPLVLKIDGENTPSRAFVCSLTPKLAFIGALGLSTGYTIADTEWVRRFNARVRVNAHKELIANTSAVDDTWFLTDTSSPQSMREVIFQLRLEQSVTKTQAKGFGK